MVGVDPTSEGLELAARPGPGGVARGRRLAARAGRAAGHRLRGDVGLRAPRERPALRGGRHPGGRPDAGRGRPVRGPAGQPRRAPRTRRTSTWSPAAARRRSRWCTRSPASTPVSYAEIVATVASVSAGPGTRANIDEFTRTTAAGVEAIGGAERGKAIIILNPAEPPLIMRDTIFCAIAPDADTDADRRSRSSRWRRRCRSTCPATGCCRSRSSTSRPRPPRAGPGWRSSSRSRAPATTCRRTPATSTS